LPRWSPKSSAPATWTRPPSTTPRHPPTADARRHRHRAEATATLAESAAALARAQRLREVVASVPEAPRRAEGREPMNLNHDDPSPPTSRSTPPQTSTAV
jgi:hypothetical protein